jgi:two-component system sensor kinase FixL
VTLRDSGPDLPLVASENLFQPFLTNKDAGMGLGLTICEVLVQANGGRLSPVPGLDGGAGFSFDLPFARAQ